MSVGFYLYKFDTTVDGGVAYQIWSGDFSAFKGRFAMGAKVPAHSAGTGYFGVRMTSPSALGDTSYPRTDALVLKKDAHLSMTDDVVQDGTRGITNDLANGECVCLDNEVSDAWTLKAPMYGSVGTLKKVGAGTVTLAGSMQMTNIVVESGTLAVSNGASFMLGTRISVALGASLVNQTGGDIPNVTVAYVSPQSTLTVPFDGTATTPFDFTAVSASDVAGWTKPVKVALSQAIPIPFSETNRFVLATFSESAGVTAEDFEDVTERVYDLPTSWLETDTKDGITTLYLVARPAIRLAGDTDPKMMRAENWSDGVLPRPGRDYYSGYGSYANRTGSGSSIPSYSFEGESFSFARADQYLGNYAQDFFATEVRFFKGNGFWVSHGNSGNRTRVLRGRCKVYPEATDASPAHLTFGSPTTYADFQMELTGNGTFRFTTQTTNVVGKGICPIHVTGMSTNFAGRLEVTTSSAQAFMDMYVTNGAAFGAALPAYSADAVRINPPSTEVDHAVSITAMADTTIDAANRGWHVTSGTLGASNDVTFVFAPPTLTLTTKLSKTGGGTLALGCATVGTGSDFAVEEGYVKSLSAGCCTNLDLTVSSGAGIKVDIKPSDSTVAAKGLVAKSILPATEGGKIFFAPEIPQDFEQPISFSAAVCTVPATQADLTDVLQPARVKNYRGYIEKDSVTYAAQGLVLYTGHWDKTGLILIVE